MHANRASSTASAASRSVSGRMLNIHFSNRAYFRFGRKRSIRYSPPGHRPYRANSQLNTHCVASRLKRGYAARCIFELRPSSPKAAIQRRFRPLVDCRVRAKAGLAGFEPTSLWFVAFRRSFFGLVRRFPAFVIKPSHICAVRPTLSAPIRPAELSI